MINTIEEINWDSGVVVICECTFRTGQFPLQVTIYLQGGLPTNKMDTMAKFVESVGSRCLISDESVNPYRFLLPTPGKHSKVVYVNVDALDQKEEYNLTKEEF